MAEDMQPLPLGESPSIPHQARAYHAYPGAGYVLPSDDVERARLETQHKVLRRAFGEHLIAVPIILSAGNKVLDCGTGSGAWLLDVAEQLPVDVSLEGIDIESRLFPSETPQNVRFQIASATELPQEWRCSFHLVHQRLLIAALRVHQWPEVINEIYRVLAPGGFVQLVEAGAWNTHNKPMTAALLKPLYTLLSRQDLLADCATRIPGILKDVGFQNIRVEEVDIPVGKWAGGEGIEGRDSFIGVFRGMKTPLLRAGGLGYVRSEQEFDEMVERVVKEWDETPGTTVKMHLMSAQKPV